MMETFKGLWTQEDLDGTYVTSLADIPFKILKIDQVLVQVFYSSLNYKDALSSAGHRGITKNFPHIPGIDAAGIVINDPSGRFKPGSKVIITGFDLGMNTHGGLAEYVSVPADWIVKLPRQLSLKKSMQIGTAGLTAGLAVMALQQNGIKPDSGPVAVSGATGGVGICSILLLKHLGYEVIAITGKYELHDFLKSIGTDKIIDRDEFLIEKSKALYPMQFAGAIDALGGDTLVKIIKSLQAGGSVAACGMASGVDVNLQIYPFILRGARILGIYSAEAPIELKKKIWNKWAKEWNFPLDKIVKTIQLFEAPKIMQDMLANKTKGRYLVNTID
jgi:putative YhdH/YhfP family quinone oxidoreductase